MRDIYIYIYICVCVCDRERVPISPTRYRLTFSGKMCVFLLWTRRHLHGSSSASDTTVETISRVLDISLLLQLMYCILRKKKVRASCQLSADAEHAINVYVPMALHTSIGAIDTASILASSSIYVNGTETIRVYRSIRCACGAVSAATKEKSRHILEVHHTCVYR
jgi:hypothetical protein